MATNTTTALDAAGRPIAVGDTVGGTTSGRYQATIIGPVVKLGKDQVKVQVSNAPGHGTLRPSDDDQVWISTRRVFLVSAASQTAACQAAADRLRAQLDLAQELYIRVPIDPLSHVVVRREHAGVDLWAVTDGSLTGLQVWVDRRWQYVSDVGRAAAFCWPLEKALAIAQEAAAAEARSWSDDLARSKEQ